jgi:hypothetical protein
VALILFLTGPIGVGKTTLGGALAAALGGTFVEGDDFQQPDKPWFASSLRVARGVVDAASAAAGHGPVVAGYPLRCIDHLYLRGRLGERGIETIFVNLSMPAERILAPGRGRAFTPWERARIAEMVAQGYDRRDWADFLFEPADAPIEENVARLLRELRSCEAAVSAKR